MGIILAGPIDHRGSDFVSKKKIQIFGTWLASSMHGDLYLLTLQKLVSKLGPGADLPVYQIDLEGRSTRKRR